VAPVRALERWRSLPLRAERRPGRAGGRERATLPSNGGRSRRSPLPSLDPHRVGRPRRVLLDEACAVEPRGPGRDSRGRAPGPFRGSRARSSRTPRHAPLVRTGRRLARRRPRARVAMLRRLPARPALLLPLLAPPR
jgi:hypothetical protein